VAKVPVGKCTSGLMYQWEKVPMGKSTSGEMYQWAKVPVGKCQWGNVEWANVSGQMSQTPLERYQCFFIFYSLCNAI